LQIARLLLHRYIGCVTSHTTPVQARCQNPDELRAILISTADLLVNARNNLGASMLQPSGSAQ
jgi:hypothetical protein